MNIDLIVALIALAGSFVIGGINFLARRFYRPLGMITFIPGMIIFFAAIFVCRENILLSLTFSTIFFLANTFFWQLFNLLDKAGVQKYVSLEWIVTKLALIVLCTWIIPYYSRFLTLKMTADDFYTASMISILLLIFLGLKLYQKYSNVFKKIFKEITGSTIQFDINTK